MANRRYSWWITRPVTASLVALVVLVAVPLSAQAPASGSLEGIITDSVHARPLAATRVVAVRIQPEPAVSVGVATDDRGQYHLDSLPGGRYKVEFASALLDSLGLRLVPREVVVAPDNVSRVDFFIPSRATLRARACPGIALAEGAGALSGRTMDADTDKPLAGANVVVSWNDLNVDRGSHRGWNQPIVAETTTDSLGQYRFCGLPTDTRLMLQLQHSGRSGIVVRMMIPDSAGVSVRELSLSRSASRPDSLDDVATADTTATNQLRGTAALSGVVRGIGGQPASDAQLRVLGSAASTRTDARGVYSLTGLPAGTQMLEVRRVGYLMEQLPVELRSAKTISQDIRLRRIVNLDSIRIVAQRSRYVDFERHRRQNPFGRFLGPEQLDGISATETSDVLRRFGVPVSGYGLNARVVRFSNSVTNLTGGGYCETNVVIDGIPHQAINLVPFSEVGAIELSGGYGMSLDEYDSRCGVIVVWTKR